VTHTRDAARCTCTSNCAICGLPRLRITELEATLARVTAEKGTEVRVGHYNQITHVPTLRRMIQRAQRAAQRVRG
jgi:hypothetical protein